jgi:serine/threonine protein kinase
MSSSVKDIPTIVGEAVEIVSPAERESYLNFTCGGDAALRRQVDQLLEDHAQAGDFLERPAMVASGITIDLPPMQESPGAIIGPYKLLEQIGEGGFGVVFMAEQSKPIERKVALKIIKPGMDTRQVIARFEAERQALALMDHPNIAKVLDAGTTASSRPYFVMELVRGVPVTEYCDEKKLSIRERLELFIKICQAVQHAHQKGVIHRDLKPSNVLVTQLDGVPLAKVIDFGVAKATGQKLTDKTLFTNFAQMIGTPLYMSPEQAEMSGEDVDTRSDIYSLGVLLYELLTGTTPFDSQRLKAATFDELRRIIREDEPPRPSTRLAQSLETLASIAAQRHTEPAKLTKLIRGELDWIVMKCLEKDRNRRYETPGALAQDVERFLRDEPVQACPPSAWYRFRKFVWRNRAAFAVAAIAALALVAVAVAGLMTYRNEQQRVTEQTSHELQLRTERQQNALEKAMMTAMNGDFDGAEKEIGKAELLGASTGQVRMLRGQVALHRGDMETAIQHLEQAEKLIPVRQPGAVAVRSMLALAYANTSQLRRLDDLSRQLDLLPPISPEDYLFKGQFETTFRPERGLQTLDEAIHRHDSVIARAARCEGRANRALITGSVDDAELALEDAQVARGMLAGNPLVLQRSVYAQLVASGIYEDHARSEDNKRVLAQARRDVQELKQFATLPFAAKACFEFFDYVGDEEAASALIGPGTEFRKAVTLYNRREFARALEATEHSRALGRGFSTDVVERGFILAELPDGQTRARAAFDEARAHATGAWQLPPPMILLLLGQTEEARQAYLQVRKNELPIWDNKWLCTYLDYNCGRITVDELLRAAGQARPKVCDAHFLLALWHISERDRATAQEHFQRCVATRMFLNWEWPWARAFLARMNEDPAWPPWIPPKK